MKTYTFNDITGILSSNSYSNAGLKKGGKAVGKQPKVGVNPPEWWVTEVTRLTQEQTFDPGIYELHLFYDRAKQKPAKMLNVQLNANESVGMSQAPIYITKEKSPDVLTYDQAISAVKKISELEHKVELLTLALEAKNKEYDELKKEFDEIEFVDDDDDESKQKMSENSPQNVMKQMVETAIPILDKHYEHKDKELNFQLMKFYRDNPTMAPAEIQKKMFPNGLPQNNQPLPQQQNGIDPMIAKMEAFFNNIAQAAPEVYNQILPYHNQAQNVQEFMAMLMQNFPQVYESLTAFLQMP